MRRRAIHEHVLAIEQAAVVPARLQHLPNALVEVRHQRGLDETFPVVVKAPLQVWTAPALLLLKALRGGAVDALVRHVVGLRVVGTHLHRRTGRPEGLDPDVALRERPVLVDLDRALDGTVEFIDRGLEVCNV